LIDDETKIIQTEFNSERTILSPKAMTETYHQFIISYKCLCW